MPGMEELAFVSLKAESNPQDAWRCCCSFDGMVYFCPANGHGILTFDVATRKTATIPTQDVCDRSYKWEGCCVVDQKIYFTPCCAPCILILDVSTQKLSHVKTDHICNREWAWAQEGSVVGRRIYFCPNQARCILVLDVDTEEVSSICTEHIYNGDRGYWGCCALDGKVYFAPASASTFMVLATSTNEVSGVGELGGFAPFIDLNGGSRFWGCAAVDGCIYYCPSSAPAIWVLDVEMGTFSHIDTETVYRGQYKWWGVCQVCSDKLYFCPNEASCILVLDTTTRELSTISVHTRIHSEAMRTAATNWSWIGCCAFDGEFFAAPGLTEMILVESCHVPRRVLTLAAQITADEISDEACERTYNISCQNASGEVIATLENLLLDSSPSDLFTAVRTTLGIAEWRSPRLCLPNGLLLQDIDAESLSDLFRSVIP